MCLLTSFFSPSSKWIPVVDEGTGQRWVFEHARFRTQVIIYLFVLLSRSSVGSRRSWRTSWGTTSKWWVQICLAFTSSSIYIRHPIQVGTSTPTITGYFEVEIGGQVVHSKKVTWSCSLVPRFIFQGTRLWKLFLCFNWSLCAEWRRFCWHQDQAG